MNEEANLLTGAHLAPAGEIKSGISCDQVRTHAQLHALVFEAFDDGGGSVAGVGQLLLERGEVVLTVGILNVGDELGPLTHEEAPAPQQVARFPEFLRVNVGLGKHTSTEQGRQFRGVGGIADEVDPRDVDPEQERRCRKHRCARQAGDRSREAARGVVPKKQACHPP